MPSLRRTYSSPSVRSSPYRYPPVSPYIPSAHATRAGVPAHRRSSGTESSRRRVLADIDWWLVQDGQRDFLAEDEDADADAPETAEAEQEANVEASDAGRTAPPTWQLAAGVASGALDGQFNVPYYFNGTTSPSDAGNSESLSPLPQFADLSLSPRTPSFRHSHSGSESSVFSLESTPELDYTSLFPMSTIQLSFMDVHFPSMYDYPPSPLGKEHKRVPVMRSTSYSAVEFKLSMTSYKDERFCDMVPSPPPYFSRTQQDADDLFF